MKKINYTHIFCWCLVLILFTACEKEVQLDLPEQEQKLTVLCNFSPNEPFSIQLSKSQSLFSDESDNSLLENANVQLCMGNELIEKVPQTSSSPDAGSKFMSMVAVPSPKEFYTLKIEVDGLKPITATSWIPEPVEISHSSLGQINEFQQIDNVKEYEVRLALQFNDPGDEKNYYQINFYQELVNEQNLQDTSVQLLANTNFSFIDETLTDNFNVLDGGILFQDLTFDGSLKELVFEPFFQYNAATYTPKNIVVELRSVSEEYYKYYTSVYRQVRQTSLSGNGTLNGSVPFSDPEILYSNIENGFGVFAGFSKSIVKTPIEF